MSTLRPTMHFLTPSFRPAGGVVKVFDYLVHALELGYQARVHAPSTPGEEELLFTIPRFTELREHKQVAFDDTLAVGTGPQDWVLFSWPTHYELIARGISPDTPHERVIHLVQNTRHANPAFTGGYARRLLARPMARIMVAEEVMSACEPHLNRESATATIVEGHDWSYFHRDRGSDGGLETPLRVAYTTWKSDIGVEVEDALGDGFEFRSIRKPASWAEIRELLHWCQVFLCCPGPEEGFYLPGLEALAAGAIVITPDVGGNRAYCRFGTNCLEVGYERVDQYVTALTELVESSGDAAASLRRSGYETVQQHSLAQERAAFGQFLVELSARCSRRRYG